MKKTIYALVRMESNLDQFSCHVYSKQTSNFTKMKEYREEIKQKYPNDNIFITSRDNAENYQREYFKEWRKINCGRP